MNKQVNLTYKQRILSQAASFYSALRVPEHELWERDAVPDGVGKSSRLPVNWPGKRLSVLNGWEGILLDNGAMKTAEARPTETFASMPTAAHL
jgi:hypothetical protein